VRGLFLKMFWETRWPVLLFGIGLALVMGLLTALLPRVLGDIHHVFERLPFIKPLITALLGVDPGDQINASMSQAFLWVHPTVLTLLWAHAVMYCTRVPAGEIDRGTVDFLLGMPISRGRLFVAESIGWILSGIFILSCGFLGHWLINLTNSQSMRPPTRLLAYIMINLFAVYLAVGSFSWLIACLSDRRNKAIGIIFAVLLASFLINFVAQFWDPWRGNAQSPKPLGSIVTAPLMQGSTLKTESAQSPKSIDGKKQSVAAASSSEGEGWSIAVLSVMNYYKPAIIIQSGRFPTSDLIVLLTMATGLWCLAGVVLSNRSICTV
jgi:ABC-2 family transporter protein